mmetsp:Transcript_9629/g.35280  ORF Transcript_9629/g.35280 Transcript_9629/m.35280 type:complete len:203 (+) Transcript_9629:2473-3081(+)
MLQQVPLRLHTSSTPSCCFLLSRDGATPLLPSLKLILQVRSEVHGPASKGASLVAALSRRTGPLHKILQLVFFVDLPRRTVVAFDIDGALMHTLVSERPISSAQVILPKLAGVLRIRPLRIEEPHRRAPDPFMPHFNFPRVFVNVLNLRLLGTSHVFYAGCHFLLFCKKLHYSTRVIRPALSRIGLCLQTLMKVLAERYTIK